MQQRKYFNDMLPYFICSLGSMFYVYDFIIRVIPGTIANDLMLQYQVNAAGLGLLSSFFFLGYMLMQIPCGMMYDRYGPRILLTITTLIAAISTFFFIATDNFAIASIARLFMGMSTAFAYIGALFLASRWLPARFYALTAGLIQFMGSIGAIIGEAPIATLVAKYNAYTVTAAVAVLGILLAILFWLFLRDYPENKKTEFAAIDRATFSYLKEVLRHPQNWATAAYGFMIWAPISIFASLWAVPFLMQKYNLTDMRAASLTSVIWLGVALGGPILAWLSNHMLSRRLPLIIAAFIGIIASLAILYLPNLRIESLVLFLFLFGAASSAQAVTFGLIQDNNSIHYIGTASGFNNMAIVLGGTLFQPLVGLLLTINETADKTSHTVYTYSTTAFSHALMIMPICYILSLVVVLLLIRETHCQSRE